MYPGEQTSSHQGLDLWGAKVALVSAVVSGMQVTVKESETDKQAVCMIHQLTHIYAQSSECNTTKSSTQTVFVLEVDLNVLYYTCVHWLVHIVLQSTILYSFRVGLHPCLPLVYLFR